MANISGILYAYGLKNDERNALYELINVYNGVRGRNAAIESYYEGDVMVKDIGVDVLPPDSAVNAGLSCDWPRKAVDALANLIKFRSFASPYDMDATLSSIMTWQNLATAYNRHLIGELKAGCMFATVNLWNGRVNVRFHSADNAAAIWDVERERIKYGFVIADSSRTPWSRTVPVPTKVNLHMPGKVVEITRWDSDKWSAKSNPQPLDRPLMEAFRYKPTDTKPLGTSRITKQVRDLTDDVLRVRLAMVVSTAFYAVPQKALLGLTDKQFDNLRKSKWSTYINSVLLTTRDKNGNAPTLTQLPSNSPQALIDIIRCDAALFSGATGVPLNSMGIIQDNPSSADAIETMRKDITDEAERAIESNADSLVSVARIAMAVDGNKTLDDLDEEQLAISARFANPRMPTASAAADMGLKISSVREGFGLTDVFLETQGFDDDTIARTTAQEQRVRALAAVRDAVSR